ncbi:Multiple sugar-binding protein precursor [Clostridium sp. C105KSO15]|nr:Multiple sugar-binding protein precursor [Clostridium sp. C105KSO15]
MKKTAIFILFLPLFAMVSACGFSGSLPPVSTASRPEERKEGEKTHLKLLYSRDDITWSLVMEDLCSRFENENPDIDLELLDPGNGIYEESLKVKEALNEFPDLFEIQNPGSYVENDRLGVIPETVSDLIEEPRYLDGRVYTLPLYTTTYGIVYNQVLFKKYRLSIPETYEDFLSLCQTLSSHGIAPLTCGGTREDSVTFWLNYFYQKDILARPGVPPSYLHS